MAFNAGTIVSKHVLDQRGFAAGAKKSEAQAKGLGRAMDNLGRTIGQGILAAGLTVATKKMFELADAGGQLIDMRRAFERMALSAGSSSKQVVAGARAITGALTNREIMAAANTMETLGIGMDNLPRFLEIARASSIAFGKDIGFMLESISLGTARQSRLILDNLGIIVSVEEANKRYADTLGKVASQLTDVEKKQAFTNEVLRQGQQIIDNVGASSESAAEPTQTLAATMTDLKDSLAVIANIALAKPFKGLADGLRAISGALNDERIGALIAMLTTSGMAGAATGIGGAAGNLLQRGLARLTGQSLESGAGVGGATLQNMALRSQGQATRSAREMQALRAQQAIPGGLGSLVHGGRGATVGGVLAATGGRFPFGGELAEDPLANMNESMQQSINLAGTLGDAFANIFTAAISGGEGFAQTLAAGIGSVASKMGSFFISLAPGLTALQTLNPVLAFAAGIALKAIGGVIGGIASGGGFVSGGGGIGGGAGAITPDQQTATGNKTLIISGVIDPGGLSKILRDWERDEGGSVVFQG
jgi:hypothetical protein